MQQPEQDVQQPEAIVDAGTRPVIDEPTDELPIIVPARATEQPMLR